MESLEDLKLLVLKMERWRQAKEGRRPATRKDKEPDSPQSLREKLSPADTLMPGLLSPERKKMDLRCCRSLTPW